ncbi:unnamed protein product, partial [Laminaria digitata]
MHTHEVICTVRPDTGTILRTYCCYSRIHSTPVSRAYRGTRYILSHCFLAYRYNAPTTCPTKSHCATTGNFFFFIRFIIFALLFSLPPVIVVTQIRGHKAGSSPP